MSKTNDFFKSILEGGRENFGLWASSLNKGIEKTGNLIGSEDIANFGKFNKKHWEKHSQIAKQNITNPIGGVIGSILSDPTTYVPGALITKGAKGANALRRYSKLKSGAVGGGVALSSQVARDYGNDKLSKEEKAINSLIALGLGGAINAGIAGYANHSLRKNATKANQSLNTTINKNQPKASIKNTIGEQLAKLEERAQNGDMLAQTIIGKNYLFTDPHLPNGKYMKGAFSDTATKQVMGEIDDRGAKFILKKDETWTELENILSHDELYKKYPELKHMPTHIKIDKNAKSYGAYTPFEDRGEQYYPITEEINIFARDMDEARSMLLHEIQHAIQAKEKWQGGGNPSEFSKNAFQRYQNLHGEQMARATEYRQNMTPDERIRESYTDTLKRVEGEAPEPIVKHGYGEAMSETLENKYLDKIQLSQETEEQIKQIKNYPKEWEYVHNKDYIHSEKFREDIKALQEADEILFKVPNKKTSIRGKLINLPYGIKGVVGKLNKNESRDVYEYTTGQKLQNVYDGTSLPKVIVQTKTAIEQAKKEYEDMIYGGVVLNDVNKIRKLPYSKGTDKFHILVIDNGVVKAEQITGTKIDPIDGYTLYAHQNKNRTWSIFEESTGLNIGTGKSKTKAIEEVTSKLANYKEQGIRLTSPYKKELNKAKQEQSIVDTNVNLAQSNNNTLEQPQINPNLADTQNTISSQNQVIPHPNENINLHEIKDGQKVPFHKATSSSTMKPNYNEVEGVKQSTNNGFEYIVVKEQDGFKAYGQSGQMLGKQSSEQGLKARLNKLEWEWGADFLRDYCQTTC